MPTETVAIEFFYSEIRSEVDILAERTDGDVVEIVEGPAISFDGSTVIKIEFLVGVQDGPTSE